MNNQSEIINQLYHISSCFSTENENKAQKSLKKSKKSRITEQPNLHRLFFPHGTLVPMIIGEIKRYLRDNTAIRVSRSMRDLACHALQAKDALSHKLADEPTHAQIAEYMTEKGDPHTADEIAAALEAITAPMSLFDPICGDGTDQVYIMDQLSDSTDGENIWLESIALRDAMKGLNERERRILSLRFFRGRTQMEIAAEIGISQAQVSRLEKGALERIKKQM